MNQKSIIINRGIFWTFGVLFVANAGIFIGYTNGADGGKDDLIVQTTYGKVRGKSYETRWGNRGQLYLGIPYALPPEGQLRFRPAQQYNQPWDGVRDATEYRDDCWMSKDNGYVPITPKYEDCLYINIMTSQKCRNEGNCPVLFYIYGGGGYYGSPREYNPELMINNFVSKDILFVIFAYRMGTLGFWHTDSDDAEGNYQLSDQAQALFWVNSEIGQFGGDRNRVTVMGDSSGAIDSSSINLSPLTQDLFAQTVLLSGDAVLNTPTNDTALGIAFAQQVGCVQDESEWNAENFGTVANCMRALPIETLMEGQRILDQAGKTYLTFRVTPGRGFFPDTPGDLAKQRSPKSMLIGTTKQELNGYIEPIFDSLGVSSNSLIRSLLAGNCKSSADVYGISNIDALIPACISFYSENSTGLNTIESYSRSLSDIAFNLPGIVDAHAMVALGGRAFFYSFDYVYDGANPHYEPGHAQDLNFVLWDHKENYTDRDSVAREMYTTMFANFVHHGDPTPSLDGVLLTRFPSITGPNDFTYYSINVPDWGPHPGYHEQSYRFWTEFAPTLDNANANGDQAHPNFAAKSGHLLTRFENAQIHRDLSQTVVSMPTQDTPALARRLVERTYESEPYFREKAGASLRGEEESSVAEENDVKTQPFSSASISSNVMMVCICIALGLAVTGVVALFVSEKRRKRPYQRL